TASPAGNTHSAINYEASIEHHSTEPANSPAGVPPKWMSSFANEGYIVTTRRAIPAIAGINRWDASVGDHSLGCHFSENQQVRYQDVYRRVTFMTDCNYREDVGIPEVAH